LDQGRVLRTRCLELAASERHAYTNKGNTTVTYSLNARLKTGKHVKLVKALKSRGHALGKALLGAAKVGRELSWKWRVGRPVATRREHAGSGVERGAG